MVAVTGAVFRSTRATVESPQFGTQRLPKAATSPEQGCLPTDNVAPTRLVDGARRDTLSFGLFDTQTASSIASQSGVPGTGNTASGFNRSIGTLIPGVLTPGRGAGVACRTRTPRARPEQIFTITTVHNIP